MARHGSMASGRGSGMQRKHSSGMARNPSGYTNNTSNMSRQSSVAYEGSVADSDMHDRSATLPLPPVAVPLPGLGGRVNQDRMRTILFGIGVPLAAILSHMHLTSPPCNIRLCTIGQSEFKPAHGAPPQAPPPPLHTHTGEGLS